MTAAAIYLCRGIGNRCAAVCTDGQPVCKCLDGPRCLANHAGAVAAECLWTRQHDSEWKKLIGPIAFFTLRLPRLLFSSRRLFFLLLTLLFLHPSSALYFLYFSLFLLLVVEFQCLNPNKTADFVYSYPGSVGVPLFWCTLHGVRRNKGLFSISVCH